MAAADGGPAEAQTVHAGAVVVVLAPALVNLFPEAPRVVTVQASSVRDIVLALDQRWPGMGDRLCDSTPSVRRHINVFVDGARAGLDTPIEPGARVYILTAISGG